MRFIPFLQNFNNDEVSQTFNSFLSIKKIKPSPKYCFDMSLTAMMSIIQTSV